MKKRANALPRAAWALLGLECLVLVALLVRLARPLLTTTLDAATLQPAEAGLALAVDETGLGLAAGQADAFAEAAGDSGSVTLATAALPALRAGRYAVTVQYAAPETPESTPAGTLTFLTGDAVDVAGSCELTGGQTAFSGHFWLYNDTAEAGLTVSACTADFRVQSVTIREVWSWRLVRLLTAAVLFALLDAALLWLRRQDARRRLVTLALAGLVLLVSLPCLGGFAPYGTDLHYHMARVSGIAEGLRTGQFPVFLYPDFLNGYGYASPVFYGEALLYLPALLLLAGFPLFEAYNAFNILVNILTVAVCYLCLYKIFRRRLPAFVGTVLYAACNYRLFNLYWRQAAGEITAQIFLPVVLYGFWALYADDADEAQHRAAWLPLTIGFTGLVQSHLLTTEITALAAAVLVLGCLRKALRRDNLLLLGRGALCTVLLNLGFLVPFLSYMGGAYRITDTSSVNNLTKTAVNWTMLLDFWTPTNMDTLRLGAGAVLGVGLYLGLRAGGVRQRKADQLCVPCLTCAAVCVYLCSSFDWSNLARMIGQTAAHYLLAVQFPFRYLVLAAPCLAFAGAAAVWLAGCKGGLRWRAGAAAALLLVAMVPAWLDVGQYLRGDYGRDRVGEARELDSGKVSSALEYLPLCFDPETSDSTALVVSEGAAAAVQSRRGLTMTIEAQNPTGADASVALPLLYYPGYRLVESEGGLASVAMGADGKVTVVLAAGFDGTLTVGFRAPFSWRLAEAISTATLVALAACGLKKRLRRKPCPTRTRTAPQSSAAL